MIPEVKSILAVLRNAAGSGRGTLTLADVERLEALASLAEAQEVLLSGGRCSYCGHVDIVEDMPKHIATCAKHPMTALAKALEGCVEWAMRNAEGDPLPLEFEEARAALAALVKEGTP